MSSDDDSQARTSVGRARLEAFSDGVFAIAITLLVLDLSIGRSGSPHERVLHAWPFYAAYLVSFLTIGAAWLAHTGITDRLTRVDSLLLRINLLLLLVVVLLPFPTRLAIGVGVALPRLAVALYFGLAVYLVVPFREIARLFFHRP